MTLRRFVYKILRPIRWVKQKRGAINAIRSAGNDLKIIVGANFTAQQGWVSADYLLLDLTESREFEALLKPESVTNILAEHVWEHLSPEGAYEASRNCYKFLKKGGLLRIAVPDGFHPDLEYINQVRPGGIGAGADDHKILYNYQTLSSLLEKAGYSVRLVEWFDEHGIFHKEQWNIEDGFVSRSSQFDERNKINPTAYTSLIVDARKPR